MKGADVRLLTGEARVLYDDMEQSPESLAAAVDRLGFQARVRETRPASAPTLHLEGPADARAARRVERALRSLPGVRSVLVDPGRGQVFVDHDSRAVTPGDLLEALLAAGLRARPAAP